MLFQDQIGAAMHSLPELSTAMLAPVHLLAYSTLLGTELYQSFVMTKVAYQALPKSAFTTLQKRVFPIYFQSQSALLLLVAATTPPLGPISMLEDEGHWIPLTVAGLGAALNLTVFGPKTKQLMLERVHQATRDSKAQLNGSISDDMKTLNRAFSKAHAMSIHCNLIAIGATLWYGWQLASRLQFKAG